MTDLWNSTEGWNMTEGMNYTDAMNYTDGMNPTKMITEEHYERVKDDILYTEDGDYDAG